MKALVAYESIFGNTKRIAEAVARGLGERFEVELLEICEAPECVDHLDLVVIGGPTHVWGMTRGRTRDDARKEARDIGVKPVSPGIGVRDWLDDVAECKRPILAAAFDTALRRTGWFPYGSAAKGEAHVLREKGFDLIGKPVQFYVEDKHGPLESGEVARAFEWGRALAAQLEPA